MAEVTIDIVPDDGRDLTENRTRGFCASIDDSDTPVWGIFTKVEVPEQVCERGVEAVVAFLKMQLAEAGPAVSFEVQLKESEIIDPRFAPEWIYAESLSTVEVANIFRKRGHSVDVVWSDDQFGDETRKAFRGIAIPGEELITTDELDTIPLGRWRIRRPLVPGMVLKHRDPTELYERMIVILQAQYKSAYDGSALVIYRVTDGQDTGAERVVSDTAEFDHFRLSSSAH